MEPTNKVDYRVKKVTIARTMCSACKGTGKLERKVQGAFRLVDCCHCRNGVATIEHQTDISLLDALIELGIRFVLPASMKPENSK